MFKIVKKIKKSRACLVKLQRNGGMTYVELIVVLSIFSIMSAVVLFNYGKFQAKVDINNLANDIALKIVQAQKDAMSGKLPAQAPLVDLWKPSFGVYFDKTDPTHFVYFTDLDQNKSYDVSYDVSSVCPGNSECLDKIFITKNNEISDLQVFDANNNDLILSSNDLSLTFTRPNSGVIMESDDSVFLPQDVSYAQITITSPQSVSARIKLYPSGRVEILSGTDKGV